jgi:Tol biopolymer transport system component
MACDRFVDGGRDVYVWDFERESLSRLTDDPREDLFPHWSKDGSRLFFSSNRTGAAFNIFSRAADGSGQDELLTESDTTLMLFGVTPDGGSLVVGRAHEDRFDLVTFAVASPSDARTLLATDADEKASSVSPDGRFIAYESNDEGQFEVFVAPFLDASSRRWKISSGGGSAPLWSPRGDEIFFLGPTGAMMAAKVELEPTFVLGEVAELFPNPSRAEFQPGVNGRRFDVSPLDGRFLMPKEPDRSRGSSLIVVLNALPARHSPV